MNSLKEKKLVEIFYWTFYCNLLTLSDLWKKNQPDLTENALYFMSAFHDSALKLL